MTEEQLKNVDVTNTEDTADTEEESSAPISENDSVDTPATDGIAGLQAEIERLTSEAQTNLDGWQRSRAEFANYKRRTTQELADSRERGALEALGKLLPVIDDFERALENVPDDLQDHPWVDGTSLIVKNIQKVLDEYKVEVIDPVGEDFDPNCHEAIGTEDTDEYDTGVVTVTLQKGYRSGERVLRPALVRVAS